MNNLSANTFRAACVGLALSASSAVTGSEIEPLEAFNARLADQALVLDIVQVESRYFAVGERGHVLISEDGRNWRQAEHVPVQATLTRITHADGRLWAVGHDTTIISSRDGGENWELQFFDPEREMPLLDVLFFNADEGIAIGAYGVFLTTDDGGEYWEDGEISERVTSEAIDWEGATEVAEDQDDLPGADQDIEDWDNGLEDGPWDSDDFYDAETDFDRGCYELMECHLNKVLLVSPEELMIAAERGYGYRSTDRGDTWESFRFPYTGSMFGLLPVGEGCIAAFGLRGHIQQSCDFGDVWEILDSGTSQTLMGGVARDDGSVVLVGAGATRIRLYPDGRLEQTGDRLGSDFAAVAVGPDDRLILGGEDGLRNE